MQVLLTVTYKLKSAVREAAVPNESAVAPPVVNPSFLITKRQPKKSSTLHLKTSIVGRIASLNAVIHKAISTHAAAQTERCSRQPLLAVWTIQPHNRKAPAPKRLASAKDQSLKTGETAMRRQRSSNRRWIRQTRVRSWGLRLRSLRPRPPLRKQKGPPDRRWPPPTLD